MSLPLHLLSDNLIHTWHITQDTPFLIEEVDACSLLTPQRLDLTAKLIYISAKESNEHIAYAKELYSKHIEAFSQGSYSEPGDSSKASIDAFFATFDRLINDIKTNGLDATKSLIPVGAENIILDGAHRTACAIYFKKRIKIIRFPNFSVDFGYTYFQNRHLRSELLHHMAQIYTKYTCRPIYCACLWPVAVMEKRGQAIDIIRQRHNVIYNTEVMLSLNGLRNLMLQIYHHQDWIGTPENHFEGVMGKVNACFDPGMPTEVILFEGGALSDVLCMKDEIRSIFKLDKHAIHISDSTDETQLMAELLFNENSCHALNFGKPDFFPSFWNMLLQTQESDVITEEATLAFYGIRMPKQKITLGYRIYAVNPRTYFVFLGRKLPALHIVKGNLVKKTPDYNAVCDILRKSNTQSNMKRKMEYWRTSFAWTSQRVILRCKQVIAKVAQKVGIYETLHKFLCLIRG